MFPESADAPPFDEGAPSRSGSRALPLFVDEGAIGDGCEYPGMLSSSNSSSSSIVPAD
jgi:hypothetical protein